MDLYEVLRVSPLSSSDEIRAAFRAQAKLLHPDAGGDPEAFKRLAGAFEVLREPVSRAAYDRSRDAAGETGTSAASDFVWKQWAEAAQSAERRAARAQEMRQREAEAMVQALCKHLLRTTHSKIRTCRPGGSLRRRTPRRTRPDSG
jgi:curved DNA-binding protein CbpA